MRELEKGQRQRPGGDPHGTVQTVYLLSRHVIAPEAGGGAQILGQGVERLGLLVEEPHLERRGR